MKVDEMTLASWHEFAKSKQMHLSNVIKRLMSNEELPKNIRLKKEPKRRYSKVNPLLLRELNAIGNNINQISRHMNTYEHEKFDAIILLSCIEQQLERVLHAHEIS